MPTRHRKAVHPSCQTVKLELAPVQRSPPQHATQYVSSHPSGSVHQKLPTTITTSLICVSQTLHSCLVLSTTSQPQPNPPPPSASGTILALVVIFSSLLHHVRVKHPRRRRSVEPPSFNRSPRPRQQRANGHPRINLPFLSARRSATPVVEPLALLVHPHHLRVARPRRQSLSGGQLRRLAQARDDLRPGCGLSYSGY